MTLEFESETEGERKTECVLLEKEACIDYQQSKLWDLLNVDICLI